MDWSGHVLEWVTLALRWLHVITGIAWIGSSFYFVFLDLSLRKRDGLPKGAFGESWSVHGGGFYHVQKYLVAPETMPRELHWFKWESYATWISGFFLMFVIYYLGANSWLIDASVLDMEPSTAIACSLALLAGGWILYDLICRSPIGQETALLAICVFVLVLVVTVIAGKLFAPRAALLHVGAVIATIMSANVFIIIIPNQKKVVAHLVAGNAPPAYLGAQAKQRSTHNNYLTLAVLFAMIGGHAPVTYTHPYLWVLMGLVMMISGVLRHYFNTMHSGSGSRAWQWPAVVVLGVVLVVFTGWRPDRVQRDDLTAIGSFQAITIIGTHCATCHAENPSHADYDEAPNGLALDSLELIRTHASAILAQTVNANNMPLGNETGMTQDERDQLGQWIASGTPD